MRALVLLVLALAAGKLGYQEYVYRSSLAEVVLNTYRQDAVQACEREARSRNLSISYVSWRQPESVEIVVGRGGSGSLWKVGDELWSASGRDPFLVITARKQPFGIVCEFDIVRQVALVSRG